MSLFKKFQISPVLIITFILIIIGLIFITLSSLADAQTTFNDKYFYLKKQSLWVAFGFIALIVSQKMDLKIIFKLIKPAYLFCLITLVAVLIPQLGISTLGASRWINLGPASFQPSELFKFIAVIFFAQLFSQNENRHLKNLIIYLGIPLILILLEPNMSTTFLIGAIITTIYYLSGSDIKELLILVLVTIGASILLIVTSPYRQARLLTLLNPSQNTSGASYHANQIIISLASGGIFGKGFGNSSQKYQFLPEITSDSILAVIGEETGFIGISIVIFLYVLLIVSMLKIARQAADIRYQLLASGIAVWIAYQSLINIAAIASIIPLTGVPLPMISSGGSSIVTIMAAIGIILNINKLNKSKPNAQKN